MVLEVIATHTTMASEDGCVYLRAFSDGTAECQPSKHSDSEKRELLVIKKTLTQDEFIRIRSVVSEPTLAAVKPSMRRGTPSLILGRTRRSRFITGTTTNHPTPEMGQNYDSDQDA
jgi:hypothetical protein